MARKEKAEQYLDGSAAVLRRIIASGGNLTGTFCLVGAKEKSSLAVFLKKQDPSGAKSKSTARELKQLTGARKIAIGVILFNNGRLYFHIIRGALKAEQARKILKNRFTNAKAPLPSILRRVLTVDGMPDAEPELISSSEPDPDLDTPVEGDDDSEDEPDIVEDSDDELFDPEEFRSDLLAEIANDHTLTPRERMDLSNDLQEAWAAEAEQVSYTGIIDGAFDRLLDSHHRFVPEPIDDFEDQPGREQATRENLRGVLENMVLPLPIQEDIQSGQLLPGVSTAFSVLLEHTDTLSELASDRISFMPNLKRALRNAEVAFTDQLEGIKLELEAKDDEDFRTIYSHLSTNIITPLLQVITTSISNINSYEDSVQIQEAKQELQDLLMQVRGNLKIRACDQCIDASSLIETFEESTSDLCFILDHAATLQDLIL